MVSSDYVSDSKHINNVSEDSKYIELCTGFHNVQILNSERTVSSSEKLIRFIRPQFYRELNNQVGGALFIPSGVEKVYADGLYSGNMHPLLLSYAPIRLVNKNNISGPMISPTTDGNVVDVNHTYIHEDRHDVSTSFFRSNFYDSNLDKVILDLKKEIRALRKYPVAVGFIEEGAGILEMSQVPKTHNPNSYHCGFWKQKDTSLNMIALNFKLV
ncbi:hypothetical protein [Convivina intestini]|uniref:Uncharacterized protein n=1 Tax=Convivina intestini TaxID=1505726 RepID=A0A2U1D4F3_9LACO|nr:hypothetical protein [Convivina intestini]PVY82564.1 hypothetical protein C7384_1111 [Convivina intestini]CAH1857313.1 hypothetical protein R077811_01471 [Convivina intestini]SDC10389.1 hypothetical protein SAMN05216341_11244 [Leuconostocaceae bacterium R-53105]